MGGTNLELAKAIVAAAGKDCRVTIAGGVTTAEEIRALDEIGADAQVGMALYTGRLDLADAIMAPLVTDRPDGLYPTVVVDERGVCLGLVYSSQGIDPRGRAAADGHLPVPLAAACGSRARPAAPRRSCCASTSTATATARASSSASPAPASATSTPAPAGARTPGLGRLARTLAERREQAPRGQLHRQAVRRPGAARRQAARGGGRARRGARPRARDLGGRRRALLHARPARRARASTSPRSRRISTAGR